MSARSTAVECYAGARYPERPRAFTWDGSRRAVETVERCWCEPGALCFRVRTVAGDVFLLRYTEGIDAWSAERLASDFIKE